MKMPYANPLLSESIVGTVFAFLFGTNKFMSVCAAEVQTVRSSTDGHLIGEFIGRENGPSLMAIGSIHGNEPSGARALEIVAERLETVRKRLLGRVYLFRGNCRAFARSVRYIDADLNRHWTRERIIRNSERRSAASSEDKEQHELLRLFRRILGTARDEVYVLDLHSTSAGGRPFATVGDTLRNRAFAQKLPVTMLLGIEEQLKGTMLEFLNNEGTVTLGFEAGQHLSPEAANNHVSLVLLSLVNAGILLPEDLADFEDQKEVLAAATVKRQILEVRYREPVEPQSKFLMNPGFRNFEAVKRGQCLAVNRNGVVEAPETGLILMPLYQKQGEDGFFIVREVAAFWLTVSKVLRKLRVPDVVHLLPGVRRFPGRPETVIVDTRIARFVPLQIFHLLGFRRLQWERNHLVVSRRQHDTVSPFRPRG